MKSERELKKFFLITKTKTGRVKIKGGKVVKWWWDQYLNFGNDTSVTHPGGLMLGGDIQTGKRMNH
jgi:hypothetical protein